MRFHADRYRRPVLDYIYIPITLECIRNCRGCVSFSPLANSETRITVENFEKALKRVIDIAGDTIQQVDISGGEPLCHPDILKFLGSARSIFPKSKVVIRSNGILLPDFIERNYHILNDLSITIEFSEYPNSNKTAISDLCRIYHLELWNNWGTSDFKFLKTGICTRPNYRDMNEEWWQCFDSNACHTLRIIDDKTAYYTGCSAPVYIDIFDKYFGTSYESLLKKGDRINIYDESTTLDDFLNFHQPIMFCAHCRRRTGIYYNNNEISEKSRNEWEMPF
jgi:organic radical activating enzyme